jgi:hypothetical protein
VCALVYDDEIDITSELCGDVAMSEARKIVIEGAMLAEVFRALLRMLLLLISWSDRG